MPSIYEVADQILATAPYGLSNRELQKLLYLAQGFYLAQTGEPLFAEEFQAWRHGPVHSGLYHKYKDYGYHSIARPAGLPPLAPAIAAFVAALVMSFGTLGQYKLIEYSHADIPWASKYIPDQNIGLSKADLKEYFQKFTSFDDYKAVNDAKVQFHELINARASYLSGLPQIGNAWISGTATAPTARTCEVAKNFLMGLKRTLFASEAKPKYPKLVMGPIPAGGVSLEFYANKTIYLHLNNNETVDLEVEENDHFTDYQFSLDQLEENFAEVYRMILT